MTWTDERIAELTRLKREGLSISEIGRVMGTSRCAVVGKLHRLGLTRSENSPIVRLPATASATLPSIERARSSRRSLDDWRPTTCSWPLGDPKTDDFSFCGAPIEPGRPYCSSHCAVAYVTPKEGKADGLRPIGDIAREVVEKVRER